MAFKTAVGSNSFKTTFVADAYKPPIPDPAPPMWNVGAVTNWTSSSVHSLHSKPSCGSGFLDE